MIPRFLLALFAFILLSTDSLADVIRYRDDQGQIHYVDNVDKVPAQYRDQVKSSPPMPGISRVPSPERQEYYNQKQSTVKKQPKVEIFVTEWCPYCRQLEDFLKENPIKLKKKKSRTKGPFEVKKVRKRCAAQSTDGDHGNN